MWRRVVWYKDTDDYLQTNIHRRENIETYFALRALTIKIADVDYGLVGCGAL
jgi:hypothetical protein